MSVKLRRSSGSAKCVFIVDGRSSSVRSSIREVYEALKTTKGGARQTFLYAYLCGTRLWLLLGRRILVLLHAKNLCDRLDIRIIHGDGADLQHGGLFAGRWWGEVEV